MVTRNAKLDDIYAISQLFAASWKYAYKDVVNAEYLNSLMGEHWVDFLKMGLSEYKIDCILAEEDSEIIGAAVIRKSLIEQYPNDGELVCLYLLPKQIGKGVGKILFKVVTDLLKRSGYTHCILNVLTENRRAKAFYKKHGFEQMEFISKTTLGNQELECNVMRKALFDV